MKTRVATKTGLKLVVMVEMPKAIAQTPLVILLHGNTGWKEEVHIASLSKSLADAGISTIRFDAPGSGESEGTWEEDYRPSNYIEATKDVLNWAIENLNIDKKRVGIWGHSMGGMVAVQVASRWPADYVALCGCQPSTGRAPQTDDWEKRGGFEMKTQIFGKVWLPKEFFIDRLQYSTEDTVKSLAIPQLYIAGTKDNIVSAEAVQKIYKNATDPKYYKEYPTNHFYKEEPEILQEINKNTVHFFKDNLL